ncbi:MAG: lipid III flippase WzxE [Candidatus Symbiodolus clandestinus]
MKKTTDNKLLVKIFSWTAASTSIKISLRILVHKLIAVNFGLENFGKFNNMSFFSSYLDNLSGAGIFNGINKYISQFHKDPFQQQQLLGTASTIVFLFSAIITAVFFLFTNTINQLVCLPKNYLWLIRAASVVQLSLAISNLLRAIFKGEGNAVGNSLSIIIGSGLGLFAFWIGFQYYGYCGVLTSLMLMPAWTLVPAVIIFYQYTAIPWHWLIKLTWNSKLAIALFKFSLIALLTTSSDILAAILLRNRLKAYDGWTAVGLWQGIHKYSEIYFQVTTSFLSVYLLPLLAKLQKKDAIKQAIRRVLHFILPAAILVSSLSWVFREKLTLLLFSKDFMALNELYGWQLTGDIFKIANATFTSLILSKALLGFHILSLVWLLASTLLFSYFFIPRYGTLGVAQAHLATHLLYFIIASIIFFYYTEHKPDQVKKKIFFSKKSRLLH